MWKNATSLYNIDVVSDSESSRCTKRKFQQRLSLEAEAMLLLLGGQQPRDPILTQRFSFLKCSQPSQDRSLLLHVAVEDSGYWCQFAWCSCTRGCICQSCTLEKDSRHRGSTIQDICCTKCTKCSPQCEILWRARVARHCASWHWCNCQTNMQFPRCHGNSLKQALRLTPSESRSSCRYRLNMHQFVGLKVRRIPFTRYSWNERVVCRLVRINASNTLKPRSCGGSEPWTGTQNPDSTYLWRRWDRDV